MVTVAAKLCPKEFGTSVLAIMTSLNLGVCFTSTLPVFPSVPRPRCHTFKVATFSPRSVSLRNDSRVKIFKGDSHENTPRCLTDSPLAGQPENDATDGSDIPPDVFAAFDAVLGDLERDLEQKSDPKPDKSPISPAETYRRKRDIERQERLERQQLEHERRLQILTSLPAELFVEDVPDKCPGCGALIQSESADRPGYLPESLRSDSSDADDEVGNRLPRRVCQRCFRLTHYGDIDPKLRVFTRNAITKARKVSAGNNNNSIVRPSAPTDLTPGKFRRCLEQLQSINAVVIYLVDIYDFHGTFIPKLRDIIGRKCPLILAVNKIDLLPKDYKVSRIEKWILYECRSIGMRDINSVHFISSYRNTGVSALLADAVQLARRQRADIYVVGATNVGKSSFINQLIRRHKTSASKSKMRLSSPPKVSQPLEISEELEHDEEDGEEGVEFVEGTLEHEGSPNELDSETNDETSSVRLIDHTPSERLEEEDQKTALTTSFIPGTTLDVVKIALGKGINLYDTPGLMVAHQLTNLLDEKDLRLVVPSKSVEKVTLRVGEKKALYIGGLARVEVTQGKPFFLTCFFSSAVKLHLGKADGAEDFTKRHVGKMLTPPSSPDAYARLGDWTSKSLTVDGNGWKKACADVVLSGLGWIALTGAGSMQIRVWVPKDVGVFMREPLMPFELSSGVSTFTGTRTVNRKKKRSRYVEHADDFEL